MHFDSSTLLDGSPSLTATLQFSWPETDRGQRAWEISRERMLQ